MNPERLERLYAGFAAMNRGDFEAATEGMHPDIEWMDPPELIGGGTHRGLDEARRFWESYGEAFGEWWMEIVEVEPLGEDAALVTIRMRHRGRESGIPLDFLFFQVWEWEDEQVTRVSGYLRRSDVRA